jgi:hypothetical protein
VIALRTLAAEGCSFFSSFFSSTLAGAKKAFQSRITQNTRNETVDWTNINRNIKIKNKAIFFLESSRDRYINEKIEM